MFDRRSLLASAAALAATRFLAAPARALETSPSLKSDPFALGVASGDPGPDRALLWTRAVGLREDVRVSWEVAEDDTFRRVVRRGSMLASSGRGHAVHVEVRGLRPGRDYCYRFHLGGATSRTGRTRTIARRPERLRLALSSCQHWEHGWFSAYRDMVAQAPDAVLHVGDYIYEKSFGAGPNVRTFGAQDPVTLEDYRARHALYRTDPDLAAAHAALPFIVTWDDHEVENDYAGQLGGVSGDPADFVQRRAAAYQAYFEHMPITSSRLRADGGAQLYRRVRWGDLASLHVLDTRQYRTPQPCSAPGKRGGSVVAGCAAAQDPAATMLGAAQEQWLTAGLAEGGARWSLVGQQTFFSRLFLPDDVESLYSDLWDGYAASRDRITTALRTPAVRNPVILGGDVHSFWVNDVKRDFDRPNAATIATEIITSCLASRNGPDPLFAGAPQRNPHVRFLDNKHAGYVLLDFTPERLSIDLRHVHDLRDPTSSCSSLRRFAVEDGRAGAIA